MQCLFKTFYQAALLLPLMGIPLSAQSNRDGIEPDQSRISSDQTVLVTQEVMPLRRVTLFSAGLGFFEHTGHVSGAAALSLPFNIGTVNDALKSLVINDPDSSPSVSYPSEQTLYRTLKSLSIDLLGNPSVPELLSSLKGAEIEILIPNPVRGRIMFVEHRSASLLGEEMIRETEPYLSLYTAQGIKVISFKEISGFAFKDPQINADLNRALDIIMQSRDSDTRRLVIRLPGTSPREVALSYVIPTPIWKVSYRLDLSQTPPFLQGWAIVDNDGDTDWKDVELSLVTGRPSSFIQNLYAPYYLSRPVLPLGIAGIAEARTYDSGSSEPETQASLANTMMIDEKRKEYRVSDGYSEVSDPAASRASVAGGIAATPQGRTAGDQFEFTIKKPVSLARQQSAMLPLIEGTIPAEKTLVFSGTAALQGSPSNPAVAAELTNATGMKLPAGPITVYDGGIYAGDALIQFFPEGEKRLISYGEDLSVTGSISSSTNQSVTAVTVSQGIMTIKRKQGYEKVYTFRNASGETKRLIVEHPITFGTTLTLPAVYTEKTANLYRFALTLQQGGEQTFTVKEERPLSQEIILSQLVLNAFVSYSVNQEIPPEVQAALETAIALKQRVDRAKQGLANLENRRNRLITEQERTRQNLAAVGCQTQQGQDYLKRLTAQDEEIDGLDQTIPEAEQTVQTAQQEYDVYLRDLVLE